MPDKESPLTIRKVKSGYRLVSKKNWRTYKTKAGSKKRERQVQ